MQMFRRETARKASCTSSKQKSVGLAIIFDALIVRYKLAKDLVCLSGFVLLDGRMRASLYPARSATGLHKTK